jgi:DNA-directed RNA polymerase subunit E'/Rpb7
LNLEKPEKLTAALYNHDYIPGFKVAVKQFKNEEIIDAVVNKVSPYGVFVVLKDSHLDAKLSINEKVSALIEMHKDLTDQVIQVKIKHISSDRIVIELV